MITAPPTPPYIGQPVQFVESLVFANPNDMYPMALP